MVPRYASVSVARFPLAIPFDVYSDIRESNELLHASESKEHREHKEHREKGEPRRAGIVRQVRLAMKGVYPD